MSADTFVNALFLITAVVAAGILITAVFPIVWNMAGTFSTASHDTDARMRTDFKIVTTYASVTSTPQIGKVWMKNVGSSRVGKTEIEKADVFFGPSGKFNRVSHDDTDVWPTNPANGQWNYHVFEESSNEFWESGETLEIVVHHDDTTYPPFALTDTLYFQFVLPNGVSRSSEFTPVS